MAERQIVQDLAGHEGDDVVGGAGRHAGNARLAMDAHADEDLVLWQGEHRQAGQRRHAGCQRRRQRAGGVAHALPKGLQFLQAGALFGPGADDFVNEGCAGPAAPPVQLIARGGGDVVVHPQRLDLDAGFPGQVRPGLAIHDVAGMVGDQEQNAGAGIGGPDGIADQLRRRCGENVADRIGVQHAVADPANGDRLVAGAVADHQPDLARPLLVGAYDDARIGGPALDVIGPRLDETVDHLVDGFLDLVQHLFHEFPPTPPVGS